MNPLVLMGVLAVVEPNAQLEAIWKTLKPDTAAAKVPISWSWRLTPAIPAEWPAKPPATVVRYAYAVAMDISISDGERNSAPFARLEIAPDGTTKVTALVKTLGPSEIQGVKPITREEAAKQSGDGVDVARAGSLEKLNELWCTWRRYHGVVGSKLEPMHQAFFAALACK
ncbi:MAG: hypothetical protein U0228_29460 [Myxococcaceae bacterium]